MKPNWPRPWRSLFVEGEAEFAAAQLQRELIPGHPLYGINVTPLARRDDTNDILFALSDGRVAQVHLSWKNCPFTVELPWAVTFACIDDFLGEVREHSGDNAAGSVFVDTDHPANQLALTALANPLAPLFKLPGDTGDETDSIDGPPGEH